MEYNDTNAEEWKRHFELEEDLAKRNPAQYKAYLDNLGKMGERAKEVELKRLYQSLGEDMDEEDGDGFLKINWK